MHPVRLSLRISLTAIARAIAFKAHDALFGHMTRHGFILGANSFGKQETAAFDEVFEKFEDQLVISSLFKKYDMDGTMAERSGNTVWRPMPYIAQSFVGLDQTSNFNRNYTQLMVPTTINYSHSVPLTLSATELRDMLQEKRLGEAALERLASDINVDCSNIAAVQGSIVVKRTTAATGFVDVAANQNAMTRLGISLGSRRALYSTSDYNGMAADLGNRTLDNGKSLTAYEEASVGRIASFDTYKLDYAYRLTAATGVGVTIGAASQSYTPSATTLDAAGLVYVNKDNRFQTLTVAVTSGTPKAGDAFAIANVNEVHHITKADTGFQKTFRIVSVTNSTTWVITPPIISGAGGTDPELQYKNVTAAPANGAAITFLNTVSAYANPFWQGDAFEIAPGKYEPAPDSGMAIMTATTKNGITVSMARQGAIGDLSTKYRWDVFYGLVCKQTEMAGIELFSQT